MKRACLLGALALALVGAQAHAQATPCPMLEPACIPPELPREFRGVWVASVSNIDWPSRPGLTTAAAKAELLALLDRAKATGLNAVILQVRPAGDALYASKLEPWSEYLTGRQGRAPSPAWDPLAFAVTEAHRRGMELHAWFNPYRARHPSAKGPQSASHLANRRPALVKRYGTHLWMDPGEAAVREHTLAVIVDVVRRYDIDGVHIDDYFYPYKERDARGTLIDFPDTASYARYVASGGTLGRNDWRRENVNTLVRELHAAIREAKPGVKFGVSPFGIWRPGFPWQIRGFDAHSELYADARTWLREGWVDYFTPQLYWPVQQVPQSYPVLLRWWSQQNLHGRHMWPGNYTSKVGEPGRTSWLTPEIERQIEVTRGEAGASGNVHFSAKVFLDDRDSLATRLARGSYARLALVPPSPWMEVAPHDAPRVELRVTSGAASRVRTLRVTTADGRPAPRWWLVQARTADGRWTSALHAGSALGVPLAASADRVAVRAVDRAAVLGPPTVMSIGARP
jgi:uncharacterized lipoprotein YddW (UPF0748 family)